MSEDNCRHQKLDDNNWLRTFIRWGQHGTWNRILVDRSRENKFQVCQNQKYAFLILAKTSKALTRENYYGNTTEGSETRNWNDFGRLQTTKHQRIIISREFKLCKHSAHRLSQLIIPVKRKQNFINNINISLYCHLKHMDYKYN